MSTQWWTFRARLHLFAAVGFLLGFGDDVSAQQRWYVDSMVEISGDGGSWPSAFETLQEALTAAALADPPPPDAQHEIWVAMGEDPETGYLPSETVDFGSADLRTVTFELQNRLAVYGGFRGNRPGGGEENLSQRSPEENETMLHGGFIIPEPPDGGDPRCESATGSCFGDHGWPGCEDFYCCSVVCDEFDACCSVAWTQTCADIAYELCPTTPNAYHVVTGRGLDETATLDGFTIRAGYADNNERATTADADLLRGGASSC
jgi:hypothetical protein